MQYCFIAHYNNFPHYIKYYSNPHVISGIKFTNGWRTRSSFRLIRYLKNCW